MSSIDNFVRGIQRANERKQTQKAKPHVNAEHKSGEAEQCVVSAAVFDEEQYRINLLAKIIDHIKTKRGKENE